MLMARPVVAAPPRRRIRKDSSISETTELGAEPQLADQVCTARSDSSTMRVEFSVPRFGSLNGKRRSSVGGRSGKLQTPSASYVFLAAGASVAHLRRGILALLTHEVVHSDQPILIGAEPAAGIGLALRNPAPKSRSMGKRYIGNHRKYPFLTPDWLAP